MTKHIDRAKILGHLGPDEIYENYKMGIPAAVVTRQQLRDAIRAGKFDVEPAPIGNTEQFADILDAEQVDSIWHKADSARGDEAYMRHDVFDLVNSHNNLLAEVERLQAEAEKWRVEALRKYPTPDAYEAACAALEKHRQRAEEAEKANAALLEGLQQQLRITADGSSPDEWDGTTGGSGHAACRKVAAELLSLYGGKGDTDAALE